MIVQAAAPAARKAALRTEMRRRLAALAPAEKAARSAAIAARIEELLAAEKTDGVLAAYWPRPGEPDTRHLLVRAGLGGRSVVLPRVRAPGAALTWHKMSRRGFRLTAGYRGLLEPGLENPGFAAARIALMLVPSISVDRAGRRLGSGLGFYDITFAAAR
ncbi:MAG: 5-formyltetrahydrofolate cyclo-ligase, partial [Betaproteobacteria bacterium AqS2]|nr:5-formyltetrahydrofolate cyclo-ligase [Betaproteobacteria bacterium AqS2]